MMIKIITSLLLIITVNMIACGQICHPQLITAGQDGICNTNPYLLVFEDNFNGDALDTSKWEIQGWGQGSLTTDNHQQYYSLDNVHVSSGICSIIARQDTVLRRAVSWLPDSVILSDSLPNLRTFYFTSANLWTQQKFRHGLYEIRCRIPSGHGFWPAFWTYGADTAGNSEIDVFEFWDHNTSKHHMTAHYSGYMCTSAYNGPDFSQAFHTYKVKWDDYKIDWYVDDTLKRRLTRYNNLIGQNLDCDGVQANHLYILEKTFPEDSMSIIVNVAIQRGDYAPDSSTVFPAALEIDYIRYYAQLPFSGAENDPDFQADGALPVKLYPNPGSKVITIEFIDKSFTTCEISIMDELGNIVLSTVQKGKSTVKIDVSAFKRGLYFIQIHDQKTRQEYSGTVILY